MAMKYLMTGVALAVVLVGSTAANAQTHVIGTEDDATGFTGNLFDDVFPGSPYIVASDGEAPFHPFGVPFDVSDGLDFSGVTPLWTQAPDSMWTEVGKQTWVLPATTSCGTENEPECEPVGHFISPTPWVADAIGLWIILEPDGSVSDKIWTYNTAQGAELKFYSDPLPTPEPASWAMMLGGFGVIGGAMRARRGKAAVTFA